MFKKWENFFSNQHQFKQVNHNDHITNLKKSLLRTKDTITLHLRLQKHQCYAIAKTFINILLKFEHPHNFDEKLNKKPYQSKKKHTRKASPK